MMWTTQPRFETDGVAYIRAEGEGPAVVFFHGVGLCADAWSPQLRFLAEECAGFAPDMPGHGASAPCGDGDCPLEFFIEKAEAFVEKTIGRPSIFVGHSMGAFIALAIAERRPDLTLGAAAISAVYNRTPEALASVQARAAIISATSQAASDFAEDPLSRWFDTPPKPRERDAAEACRSWLTSVDRRGYARAYAAFASVSGVSDRLLENISVPLLFLTGAEDPNSTPEMAQQMASKTQNGAAVSIPDARHMVPMTHVAETNAALARFVDECGSTRRTG